MRELWLIYAIVSLADLTLTCLYLSPELEANPIASWIWSKFGYLGITSFKILIVLCVHERCNENWSKIFKKSKRKTTKTKKKNRED